MLEGKSKINISHELKEGKNSWLSKKRAREGRKCLP